MIPLTAREWRALQALSDEWQTIPDDGGSRGPRISKVVLDLSDMGLAEWRNHNATTSDVRTGPGSTNRYLLQQRRTPLGLITLSERNSK